MKEPRSNRVERTALEACVARGDCRDKGTIEVSDPEEVLRLMRSTAVATVTRSATGDVAFSMFARGLAPSGVYKGIEWRSRPPSPLVENTDHTTPEHIVGFYPRYAKLASGWYIYHATNQPILLCCSRVRCIVYSW